MYNIKKTITLQ